MKHTEYTKINETITDFNKALFKIRYDLMYLFGYHAENWRIEGFWFDSSESYETKTWIWSSPFKVLRIKTNFFQIRELEEMNEAIEETLACYCDEDYITGELCIDNEWLYIEVLIDDFTE